MPVFSYVHFIIIINFVTFLNLDRKRPGPPLAIPIPNKKSKHHGSNHGSFSWEQMCIEVDSIDLIDSLNYSIQNQENLKAVSFQVYN